MFFDEISLTDIEEFKTILIKKKPYLKELISIWENTKIDAIEILPAKKKGHYIQYQKYALNSKMDPIVESERIFQYSKNNNKIIFLLGCGNLYIISFLLKFRQSNQITIIIEHNEELLSYLWQFSNDFKTFLFLPNCHIFTERNINYLWNYLNSLSVEKIKGNTIFKHIGSIKINPYFYKTIEEKIHLTFKSNFSSLLTKFEFEKLWFKNIFINAQYLQKEIKNNKLINFKNFFNNIPFVIIGAGPSLRYSKEILRILNNKAFLLATDASLKPLLKMNIKPHAVHILDAQIHSYFHLRGADLSDIIIFSDIVVHPFLRRTLKPLGWIYSTTIRYITNPYGEIQTEKTQGSSLIENIVGEIGSIQSGGSVSTSAFEIARLLGASKIILIGQDLSWTYRQLHCIDTHHYEKWYSTINRINSLENINETILQKRIKNPIKGIKSTITYGDHVMNLYKAWFEESAIELKSIEDSLEIYNLTYDGAFIDNLNDNNSLDLNSLPDLNFDQIHHFKMLVSSYKISEIIIHDELLQLIKQLQQLIKKYNNVNDLKEKEAFFQEFLSINNTYKDLDVFIHKIETYIERNKKQLNDERIIQLRYNNLMKDLKQFIKSYISFNTSLIHSETF